jgi:hypothetical protein
MTATEIYNYISKLRDLVNQYESLIDELKYYKNLAGKEPERIDSIREHIESAVSNTINILENYDSVKNLDVDDTSRKYLSTYYNYLLLVSIPYTLDLLNDIKKELVKRRIFEKALVIDHYISLLSKVK